jgi:hypothetical protein
VFTTASYFTVIALKLCSAVAACSAQACSRRAKLLATVRSSIIQAVSAVRCQADIGLNQTYRSVDGLPVCISCSNSEEQLCCRCGLQIDHSSAQFLTTGRLWHFHPSCGRCPTCRRHLTDACLAIETGTALCRQCWFAALGSECQGCVGAVLIQNLVQFTGHWYETCFRCAHCRVRLEWHNPAVV